MPEGVKGFQKGIDHSGSNNTNYIDFETFKNFKVETI